MKIDQQLVFLAGECCASHLVLHTRLVFSDPLDGPASEWTHVSCSDRQASKLCTYITFSSSVKNLAFMGLSGNQIQYAAATTRVIAPVRRKNIRQGLNEASNPIWSTPNDSNPEMTWALNWRHGTNELPAAQRLEHDRWILTFRSSRTNTRFV